VAFGGSSGAFEASGVGCFGLGFGVVAGPAEGLAVVGVVFCSAGFDVVDVVGCECAAGGVVVAALDASVVVSGEDGVSPVFVGGGACAAWSS
jgi:hypothetical protein